jgi:hypothetical protein
MSHSISCRVLWAVTAIVGLSAGLRESQAVEEVTPQAGVSLASLNEFERTAAEAYQTRGRTMPDDWYRFLPAMHHLLLQHREHFGSLAPRDQAATIVRLGDYLIERRREIAAAPLLCPGRKVLMLFGGEDLFESRCAKAATAFGADLEFLRPQASGRATEPYEHGGTPVEVKTTFLNRVTEIARSGQPATIVVWCHGEPESFQVSEGVNVSVGELADALLAAATRQGHKQKLDLSKLDGMFLCCFSADFSWNLLAKLVQNAKQTGTEIVLPNSMVASCARNRKAYGIVFWRAIAEYHIRTGGAAGSPALDVGAILGFVDRNLYGYGRQPTFDAQNHVVGWKVIDPDRLQDPTVIVPLHDADRATLRQILRLPPQSNLPPFMEVG